MKPLVSVIVPVYKVEEYLPHCLDSLRRQSLKTIEILLINDASPDRCGEICEEYAAQDIRFKVIHHSENRGLSAARNTGIANATADYLMFVDSDDWAGKTLCQTAYESAVQHHADLVMFAYQCVRENGLDKLEYGLIKSVTDGLKTREEAIEFTFKSYGMVAWNKLYHKKLFHNVLYPEGDLFEDTATTYKLIWRATRIYCIDKVLYYHLIARPGSIMSNNKTPKALKDSAKVCLRFSCDLYNWGYCSKTVESSLIGSALIYCVTNKKNIADPDYLVAEKILKNIHEIPKVNSWRARLMIRLFQVNRTMFDFVCVLLGRRVD